MTDIVERAKETINDIRYSSIPIGIVNELIEEVEKLRALHPWGRQNAQQAIQIEALTEEVERLRLKKTTYANLVTEHTDEIIRLNEEIESLIRQLGAKTNLNQSNFNEVKRLNKELEEVKRLFNGEK